MLNLISVLDERFDERARSQAIERIERIGYSVEDREGADDRTLAWIDLVFGGTWSGEAFAGTNIIARRDGEPIGFATYDPRGLRFYWLRGLGTQPGVGIFGPFGVAPQARGGALGPALLTLALCGLRRRGYAKALIPAVGSERLAAYYAPQCGATIAERLDRNERLTRRARTVVLSSGSGTNFQVVADAAAEGRVPLEIVALVSNAADAGAVTRARNAGVREMVVPWNRKRESRAAYDARLLAAVSVLEPELVLLLGWMHVLDARFVEAFSDVLNLHPAFLPLDPSRDEVGTPDGDVIPAFRGPNAVREAIAHASGWIGASVHRITADADRGPVLVRVPLRARAGEREEEARTRLRPIEHALVPRAIMRWSYEQ